MKLKSLKISGFKSFAKTTTLDFPGSVSAVVGPNGSGKSNVAEAIAWVMGEQSLKNLRGKRGEDLIFNGAASFALGRASVVLSFADENGDEASISRAVYKDGSNEYFVNNKLCRLKDIVEFISKTGTGTLKHHIISQGEADRLLNASIKERREMVEDALGLRIFQIKKQEGEKKLIKTEDNISQLKSLRREIQPHLRFLKKQVDKANEIGSFRDRLKKIGSAYFFNMKKGVENELGDINTKKDNAKAAILESEKRAGELQAHLAQFNEQKAEMAGVKREINDFEREMGRCEGVISHLKVQIIREEERKGKAIEARKEKAGRKGKVLSFNVSALEKFMNFLEESLEKALLDNDLSKIKNVLEEIKDKMSSFIKRKEDDIAPVGLQDEELSQYDAEINSLKEDLQNTQAKQSEILSSLREMKDRELALEKEFEGFVAEEKELFSLEAALADLKRNLIFLDGKRKDIGDRKNEIERELADMENVLGEKIVFADKDSKDFFNSSGVAAIKREIERLKMKIEEGSVVGGEVIKEYEEIKGRDEFLNSQLVDLENSKESLLGLIKQLGVKLDNDFKSGLLKINKEFHKFFELMFGGGKAELKIRTVKNKTKIEEDVLGENDLIEFADEEPVKEGLDIILSLPRKKINSLSMLSGGERALTSIALLFAMSQVNPPPFLILDETDAALDESNSRKYASMLEKLSKNTQLVLITHNRETMGVAKVLYGITMGNDGASRLLSLKLEEAERMTI